MDQIATHSGLRGMRSVTEAGRSSGIRVGQKVRFDNWLLPEEFDRLEEIRNSRFFLVKNDGAATGERFRCAPRKAAEMAYQEAKRVYEDALILRDPAIIAEAREVVEETYFMAQNAPEGCNRVHSYFTLMCVDQPFRGLDQALFALVSARRDPDETRDLLSWAPQLERHHPFTLGRELQPDLPESQDLIALTLGYTEPIERPRARMLSDLIRSKKPPRPFDIGL